MWVKWVSVGLVVVALAMLVLKIVGDTAFARAPKVAILCVPATDTLQKVDEALRARGLLPERDYRLDAFPCSSPNSPRQAVVNAVGSEAVILLAFSHDADAELKRAGKTAEYVDPAHFPRQMDWLAERIRAAGPAGPTKATPTSTMRTDN